MKIAVTGANGNVGRHVVRNLTENNHEVLCITHKAWSQCPAQNTVLDMLDYNGVYESLKGADSVIHLAAIPWPMEDNNSHVFQNNLVGAYNILLVAGLLGIKRVAIASSDCALGFTFNHNVPLPEYLPVDESHPAKPDNSYGISKLLAESMCDAMVRRFPFMSVASLRITYVLDPKDYTNEDIFAGWARKPEEGPWNLWSYIDGRDCARAFRLAAEADFKGHEVFLVSADDTRSVIPSAELIGKYFPGVKLRKEFSAYESLEDISKAERILSFRPEFSWRSCI